MTGWLPDGTTEWSGRLVSRTVAEVAVRGRAVLLGTICSVHARRGSSPWLEAALDDGTGTVTLSWTGRWKVPGIVPGAVVAVEGTVVDHRGRLLLLNPLYRFVAGPP